MNRFSGWISLIFSRKVLLALIVAVTAVYLYTQGAISAEELVDALVKLGIALAAAIAVEDGAEKLGLARAVKEDEVQAGGLSSVTHQVGDVEDVEDGQAGGLRSGGRYVH